MNGATRIHTVLETALASGAPIQILGEALTLSPACSALVQDYPDSVHLLPAADATLLGVAVGMAIAGKRPVVELAGPSALWGAVQQLGQEAGTMTGEFSAPVVVRVATGPGTFDPTALLDGISGVSIASPATGADAAALLDAALKHNGPTVILEPHSVLQDTDSSHGEGLGSARILSTGEDVTLLAWGTGVTSATKAAQSLSRDGISAEVIDLRTLHPLDVPTIEESVSKTGRVVVVGTSLRVLTQATEAAFLRLEAPPAQANPDLDSIVAAATAAVQF